MRTRIVPIILVVFLAPSTARASDEQGSYPESVDAGEDCFCTYDDTYSANERCEYRGRRIAECPDHVSPKHRYSRSKNDGMSFWVRASAGPRYADRRDPGRFGRAELEFSFSHLSRGPGFVGNVLVGLEGYQTKHQGFDESGLGLPWQVQYGWRTPTLFLGGGFGLNVLSRDSLRSGADYGLLTPFASAYLGFDLDGVRIMATSQQEWRWHAVNDTSRWVVTFGAALSVRFADDVR